MGVPVRILASPIPAFFLESHSHYLPYIMMPLSKEPNESSVYPSLIFHYTQGFPSLGQICLLLILYPQQCEQGTRSKKETSGVGVGIENSSRERV